MHHRSTGNETSNHDEREHALALDRILLSLKQKTAPDIEAFWQDVSLVGTPLSCSIEGNTNEREVTFLRRAKQPLKGVYLSLNRVTDKDNRALGMMQPVPDTDIWCLTLTLPATLIGSYRFFEIPLDIPDSVIDQLGYRLPPLPSSLDPFNGDSIEASAGHSSFICLDKAPDYTEWKSPSLSYRGTLTSHNVSIAGKERRLRLYQPDVRASQSPNLLILPDAETWIDKVGVLHALDQAMDSQRFPPTAILAIDNHDIPDRISILGGQHELLRDIVESVLPSISTLAPEMEWDSAGKIVIAGQSLGGVTALMAAARYSDVFHGVIAHSPSMWWTPNGGRRPVAFSLEDESWVSQTLLESSPQNICIRIGAGSLEGSMADHASSLHDALLAKQVDSTLTLYTGGHDYAWWRIALIEDLAALLNESA